MEKIQKLFSKILSDENLQLITGQIFLGQGILVAHQLGLFKLLSENSLSIETLATKMKLSKRAVQALISCAGALDLVSCKDKFYQLSQIGKEYLDIKSHSYYGGVLDLLVQENEIMNYKNIKKNILKSRAQINHGQELFETSDGICSTENFIRALHQKAFQPAFFWASNLALEKYKRFVDIGGGSGIHTIAVCLNNKNIKGVICDRSSVIQYTPKYVKDFNLESRIDTISLNMWEDDFPKGDVYFFSDIFHDWEKAQCIFLAKKSFESLPKGGKIILHEMLFNQDKTGPFLTSAYNMKMMAWTKGQQFSKAEIKDILETASFTKITIKKSLGNWSLVVGKKV